MTGLPPPYRVSAYNTAKQSENKMHDDAVARRFGFSGGLVPGVDVIAYMMHVPVARWGRDFLERGTIEARFIKPVYDGETATVSAVEGCGDMTLTLESRGETCATGRASLPAKPPAIAVADYLETAPVAARKPVDSQSYPLGRWLGTTPRQWSRDDLRSYLGDIREAEPVFAADGLLHPGLLQRIMNWVLVDNAMLGPWIHVGSRMQLLSAASVGDDLQARAKVIGNYDKKGHRFVELDSLIVANGERAVAHCHHIAIVEPRALAAA